MRMSLLKFFSVVLLLAGFFLISFFRSPLSFFSSVFGPSFQAVTQEDLAKHYRDKKLSILIVPGHDNESSGGQYRSRSIKESHLTLAASRELFDIFSRDNHFKVVTTRDFSTGEYTDELLTYFTRHGPGIRSFRDTTKAKMRELVHAGKVEERDSIKQVGAGNDTSYKLYAINKWANDNAIDLVLHVHFNDYPGRPSRSPGKYSGFALYVPERQYPNAKASRALAESLFNRMKNHFPVSNFPLERGGIIEDQDLIAIGSNASRQGASLLIEYEYVYEPHIAQKGARSYVFKELAYQTYLGIKEYFNDQDASLLPTTYLPHQWNTPLAKGAQGSPDILSLQQALTEEGFYPPPGKTFTECPINGNFGPCVARAVTLFQEKYKEDILIPANLSRGTGIVGEKTQAKLNELY